MGRDQRQKPRPRHHRIHLGQELLAPRDLLLHRIAQAVKGRLFRHRQGSSTALPKSTRSGTTQQIIQTFLRLWQKEAWPDTFTPACAVEVIGPGSRTPAVDCAIAKCITRIELAENTPN
jgi:hypothetical protein